MQRVGNMVVTEVLVHWSNTFPEDATWENWSNLQQRFLQFHLEDKDDAEEGVFDICL